MIFSTLIVSIVFTLFPQVAKGAEYEYWFTPKAVHISNTDSFKTYLSVEVNERSMKVANNLKSKYFCRYGNDILISTKSMQVEIIGHVFPDIVANMLHLQGQRIHKRLHLSV